MVKQLECIMATVRKATPLPHQEDYAAQRVADAVKENARPVDPNIFDGAKVYLVEVTAAGEKDLLHKLGKVPSGFLVVDTDQFVQVRRVSATDAVIRFDYSGACNVEIMVY